MFSSQCLSFLLLLLCSMLQGSFAELFTSMADVETLMFAEKEVVTLIDQYVEVETQRLEKLKLFAKEYGKKNQATSRDGSHYLQNPLNAFLVVKRLTADWAYVENLMKQNAAEHFLQNITRSRTASSARFPTLEDLQGTAVALLRLQDTYKLDTSSMAHGVIPRAKKAMELNAHDCFEVGRVAYNEGDHYHTVMWMEEALRVLHEEEPPSAEEGEILEYLAYSLYQQGNLERSYFLTKRLVEIAPHHPRAAGNLKFYSEALQKQQKTQPETEEELPPVVNQRKGHGPTYDEERDAYEALCRGDIQLPAANRSRLYCYYKNDRPFLWLAPLKAELLHLRPKIVLFRNVVFDDEADVIKELATPRLQRALVQPPDGVPLPDRNRIAKSAWLKEHEHDVVRNVNRRAGLMTDLNMDTAEDLQIANYGLGGHYEPHFDHARKEEKNAFKGLGTGNRIATVLFYLTEPEAGGATVFPELKISMFPSKNDAVFWHNLFKSGEGDATTKHAGCPVLAGDKWVSNKWIHEYGQELKRPCALDEWSYE